MHTDSLAGRSHAPTPRWSALLPLSTCLAGFALTLATFWPGLISHDSVYQYREAITGIRYGWQSPLMSVWWGVLLHFGERQAPLFVFHSVIFWGGLWMFVHYGLRGPLVWKTIAPLAIGLFPPVFALLGVVWKDVGFGSALVFAVGLLYCLRRFRVPTAWIWVFPFLFYALGVRLNGIGAALPLCFLPGLFRVRSTRRWLPAVSLFIALAGGAALTDHALVSAPVSKRGVFPPAFQSSMYHDLVGISVREGKLLLPPYVLRNRNLELPYLRSIYSPPEVNHYLWPSNATFAFPSPSTRAEVRELTEYWRSTILHHPASYLAHRLRVLEWLLQLSSTVHYPYQRGAGRQAEQELFKDETPLFLFARREIDRAVPFFFRSWPFLLGELLCVLIALFDGRRLPREAVLLSCSGILYFLPYVAFVSGADFRYVWWVILSGLLAATLCIDRSLLERRRRKSPANQAARAQGR